MWARARVPFSADRVPGALRAGDLNRPWPSPARRGQSPRSMPSRRTGDRPTWRRAGPPTTSQAPSKHQGLRGCLDPTAGVHGRSPAHLRVLGQCPRAQTVPPGVGRHQCPGGEHAGAPARRPEQRQSCAGADEHPHPDAPLHDRGRSLQGRPSAERDPDQATPCCDSHRCAQHMGPGRDQPVRVSALEGLRHPNPASRCSRGRPPHHRVLVPGVVRGSRPRERPRGTRSPC